MAEELKYDTESTVAPLPKGVDKTGSIGDEATIAAAKMLLDGIISRQPRMNEIRKNEDMYNGVNRPALQGRSNIPFDSTLMRGYVGTLLANTDEPIIAKFGHDREQDKIPADKMTAVFDNEKGPSKGAWDEKILDCKFMAALSGRGFMKLRMGNQPKFYSDVEACDHYDMVTEPQGGAELDKHLFKFQMNIFVTKEQLVAAAFDGSYSKPQVSKLITRYQDAKWFKDNDDIFNNKAARYAAFGIDIRANNYVGQPLYRLVEGVINFKGKWYYIVFSYEAKLWIRFQPLEEVFNWAAEYEGRGPWVSFATHRHPFIFWSPALADDVRPIGYAMKKVVNLTIDNLEKRNWQMRAYDPKVFTEPAQLLWRPNGLVKANLKNVADIQKGIFEFNTPDTTSITINLTQFLDGFLGKQTGITDAAQGTSNADTNGILVSNLQQSSKRMTLSNKMYRKMYTDLVTMFDYGLYQYLREPYAVKIIGNLGVRWDEEVTRDDVNKEYVINITSGLEEDEKNQTMLARREKIFSSIDLNPLLLKGLNPKWYMTEKLKTAGYSDEQTRVALDTVMDGDEELYAECAGSIQAIVDGEEFVPLNRNATTGFVQKIIYFAQDNYPLMPTPQIAKMNPGKKTRYQKGMKVFDALMAYAKAHITPGPVLQDGTPTPSIVEGNMQRRMTLMQLSQSMNEMANPTDAPPPPGGGTPAQGAPVPGQQ